MLHDPDASMALLGTAGDTTGVIFGPTEGDAMDGMGPETGPTEEKKKGQESRSKSKGSAGGKKGAGGGKKGKKGSKKSKAEKEVELDWDIPRDRESAGLNLFMPDRVTMQMMINRAMGKKD